MTSHITAEWIDAELWIINNALPATAEHHKGRRIALSLLYQHVLEHISKGHPFPEALAQAALGREQPTCT